MQERHLEPEAAKTRTEEKKLAELGDGEPSPPRAKLQELARDFVRAQANTQFTSEISKRAAEFIWHSTRTDDVAYLMAEFVRSGAAQEVSPPSPEPLCPMCCKPAIMPVPPSELEVRELKAALKEALWVMNTDSRTGWRPLREAIELAERLLG